MEVKHRRAFCCTPQQYFPYGCPAAFSHWCINYPLAHEVCIDRALPKRARRNTPALPLAESSCLPANDFISTAPSKEAAEEESECSHGPGSVVGAFLLGRKWGLMMQQRGLGLAVQDSGASITNFMRNLRESGLLKAPSTSGPHRLGDEEGMPGVQVELDGSNR